MLSTHASLKSIEAKVEITLETAPDTAVPPPAEYRRILEPRCYQ